MPELARKTGDADFGDAWALAVGIDALQSTQSAVMHMAKLPPEHRDRDEDALE